ncbi:hypothetical protein D9M72_565740 [compost metagenome]
MISRPTKSAVRISSHTAAAMSKKIMILNGKRQNSAIKTIAIVLQRANIKSAKGILVLGESRLNIGCMDWKKPTKMRWIG